MRSATAAPARCCPVVRTPQCGLRGNDAGVDEGDVAKPRQRRAVAQFFLQQVQRAQHPVHAFGREAVQQGAAGKARAWAP